MIPAPRTEFPPILDVRGLTTAFRTDGGEVRVIRDVSLSITAGRTLGLVGESGSGKSVTSLSIMGLLPDVGARIEAGEIALMGQSLVGLPRRKMEAMRGAQLAMIFQEPMTSLNPVFPVGRQVAESIQHHRKATRSEAMARVVALFEEVGLPDPGTRIHSYPHQLSGGQKQRVMIAMALACDPKLLIADEPTTALDVTIQAQILDLLRRTCARRGMAMLFITHDLAVIAEIADEVAVMYRGEIVERGDVLDVFRAPAHPYTRALLACRPRLDQVRDRLPTVADFMGGAEASPGPNLRQSAAVSTPGLGETLLSCAGLTVRFGTFTAVDNLSLSVVRGRTLGLVGESGCGKTTAGRAILRLIEPDAGFIQFMGRDFRALRGSGLRSARRQLQTIFQDPYAALNPRMTVGAAITEPMAFHGIGANEEERRERVAELLQEVGMLPEHAHRYPHEFSGGQRQRIVIARALAVEPSVIICDEPVSALDVSVQATVLNLLRDLQERRGLGYVFISHDLSVIKHMSDEIAVMHAGKVVEMGPAEAVYGAPAMEYTRRLIAAVPRGDLESIEARRNPRET